MKGAKGIQPSLAHTQPTLVQKMSWVELQQVSRSFIFLFKIWVEINIICFVLQVAFLNDLKRYKSSAYILDSYQMFWSLQGLSLHLDEPRSRKKHGK